MVFLSHSHMDQKVSYAISEWIYRLWPDIFVYITHKNLSAREKIQQYSFLHVVPHIDVFVCLLSRHSMTSNAVIDELEISARAARPIILLFHPHMNEEDIKVYSYLKELWEPKYGSPIDISSLKGEKEFLMVLCNTLGMECPSSWKLGDLNISIEKEREIPAETELPIPDVNKIISGQATRHEAIQWLALLEFEWDNRECSKGAPPPSKNRPKNLSPEDRAKEFLMYCQPEEREKLVIQLRPLVDV